MERPPGYPRWDSACAFREAPSQDTCVVLAVCRRQGSGDVLEPTLHVVQVPVLGSSGLRICRVFCCRSAALGPTVAIPNVLPPTAKDLEGR
jgi:hypothetical protein